MVVALHILLFVFVNSVSMSSFDLTPARVSKYVGMLQRIFIFTTYKSVTCGPEDEHYVAIDNAELREGCDVLYNSPNLGGGVDVAPVGYTFTRVGLSIRPNNCDVVLHRPRSKKDVSSRASATQGPSSVATSSRGDDGDADKGEVSYESYDEQEAYEKELLGDVSPDESNVDRVDLMLWIQHEKRKEGIRACAQSGVAIHSYCDMILYNEVVTEKSIVTLGQCLCTKNFTSLDGEQVPKRVSLIRIYFANSAACFVSSNKEYYCPVPLFSLHRIPFEINTTTTAPIIGYSRVCCHVGARAVRIAIRKVIKGPFIVVDLDANDNLEPCEQHFMLDDKVPCTCLHNRSVLQNFQFLSHICLIRASSDKAPRYGQIAAALWTLMPTANRILLNVTGSEKQISMLG